MQIEQFVMAYGVEQDRLRAILPDDFESLRPVLRINAEIRDGRIGYVEFNTAVKAQGKRGWLNIGKWENVLFTRDGEQVIFELPFLQISFVGVGIAGSCPAEKDNDGCFFFGENITLREPELILANKEFCDCEFSWRFHENDAHGVSIGKTLPAIPTEIIKVYPKQPFTVQNAATIPCQQVLGTYKVSFERIR